MGKQPFATSYARREQVDQFFNNIFNNNLIGSKAKMNQLKEPKIGETLNPISALKHIGKRDYHETCFDTKKLNIYREKQVLKQQSDSPVVYT